MDAPGGADAHDAPDWAAALQALEAGLLQRDVAARCLLLATLAGEHVLLLGPPGTAKSELARRLHRRLPGTRYFERLLTRFTVPEELFGPLSLRALEDDRYERLTEGYLPRAEVAFLDEVFKANSAILNTLLGLLHERQFDNGAQREPVPLLCLVGASNELPQDDGLLAFYDRFLLRVPVAPVGDAHFHALLHAAAPTHGDTGPADDPAAGRLTPASLQTLRAKASTVALPDSVLHHLDRARQRGQSADHPVSDRRWRQVAELLKVQAASRGATEVSPWDLWVLPFVLPHRPDDVPGWIDAFMEDVAHAVPLDTEWLERALVALEGQLEIEQRAPADGQDDSAGKLALAQSLGGHGSDGEMLRLMSDRARRHYSPLHVATRLAQVDEWTAHLEALRDEVAATAAEAMTQAETHPWLPPSWRARILAVHRHRLTQVQALEARAHDLRAGYAALPVNQQRQDPAPAPVPLPALP